jgi:hypothetical protein
MIRCYFPFTSLSNPEPEFLLGDEGLVGLGIHQRIHLLHTLLANLDLGDPAATMAVVLRHLVNGGGLLLEDLVDSDDPAADGGEDVGRGLDGFNGADGVTLLEEVARGLGELDVDDVTELLSGVLGDADNGGLVVGGEVNPLVFLGVLAEEACDDSRWSGVSRGQGIGGET